MSFRHLPERPYDALAESADAIRPQVFETCWTSYMPLVAAARVGKVHLTDNDHYPRTFCGRLIPAARLRFYPSPGDPRCTRCAAVHGKEYE